MISRLPIAVRDGGQGVGRLRWENSWAALCAILPLSVMVMVQKEGVDKTRIG